MPRLTRDRATWFAYAHLGLWGFFLYGFGPLVPLLRDEQGTSAAVASLHSTGIAVGALLGGAVFAPLTRRLGRYRISWLGLAGVAVGVVALAALRPLPATLGATVVIATFGMLVISGVNVVLTERHGPAAPAALSEANAACAGMGILAPLAIGAAVTAGPGWRAALAVEVVLIALVAVVALATRVPGPTAPTVRAVTRSTPARLPRTYWIAWLLMAVTGSIEVCLSLWTADVLRSHAGLSAGAASAAVAAIVGGMFIGRLVGGRFALRYPPVPLLFGALAVSLAGFTVFWASPIGWLAVTGLFILGIGNSMHYPLAMSVAFAAAGPAADRAAGYASYSMGIGFGIAPVALGWVADGVGPHLAFLLLPGFIGLAALLASGVRKGPFLSHSVEEGPPPNRDATLSSAGPASDRRPPAA
ncbi:MFS transporter [Micromonospora sp. CPCC 206060]|uniref:MFS transporter n=1 Tax=Micromonospora sp. CPCC 206060 TaxID=3122406 RepID=UPI002FEEA7F8